MTTELLNESFKEKVFEYDKEKEWKFKGDSRFLGRVVWPLQNGWTNFR